MKYTNAPKQILDKVGGEKNIKSVTHCMTRLRFRLKDESIVSDEEVKNIPGVMGIMRKGGQVQVIMGNEVAEYYKELAKLGNFKVEDPSESGKEKEGIVATLMDIISTSMGPLIPALIGGGMIKVILILLTMTGVLSDSSQSYAILNIFGDAPFYFIPVMLAYTSSKKFKVTPMLAVTVAGIMLHPNFSAMVAAGDPVHFFGLPITLASYSSTVIPILIMVWLMGYIEKGINKVIPAVLKSFLQPLLIILISGTLALVVVGPLGSIVGEWLSSGVLFIQDKAGWLATGLMAAFMPLIVMTGMHWAFAPIFLIASPETPDTLILVAMLASNLAQGSASLAVSLKTKNKELKSTALAASISALVAGVTEPALYGITLRLKKPLYAAMIAGGIVGVFEGLVGIKALAFAVPSLVALPQFADKANNMNLIYAVISAGVVIVLTFILTWIIGFDDPQEEGVEVPENIESGSTDTKKIGSPLKGKMVALSEVPDEVFAKDMMGKGAAVIPSEGNVVSPINGKVITVFPTKHAIGLLSDSGVELMIHVGIDTVQLEGKHYEAHVKEGDRIRVGDPLLSFDIKAIEKAGYNVITPVVVTNTADYIDVVADEAKDVTYNDTMLVIL